MVSLNKNTRYYMGRHLIRLINVGKKKALIQHLQQGYVGNKQEGYKIVYEGEYDICLIRTCRHKKKGEKNEYTIQ